MSQGEPAKKEWVFRALYFYFLSTLLYSKKSSIKPLFTYIFIHLIYVEGNPQCGGIFFAAGAHNSCAQVGKEFPTIAAHPGIFFGAAR
jgi:hypothetical protein